MRTEIPLLQYVKVAAPCSADWNEMAEVDGDRVKFCSGCQKRVYNLSAMGQAEAEGLLRKHEGHLCVRYYRRTDGTILTTDCPVGLKAVRQLAFQRAKISFAACVVFCLSFALHRANLAPREQGGVRMQAAINTALLSVTQEQAEEEATPINDQESENGTIRLGFAAPIPDDLIQISRPENLSRGPVLRAIEQNIATEQSSTTSEKHE